MCGIIYVDRQDGNPAGKPVLKRYHKQRRRGSNGFGYIAVKDGKVTGVVRDTDEDGIEEKIMAETATEILFHHRLPTSTPNVEDSTHPIVVKSKLLKHNYYFVHNGVLQNDKELRKEHEELGFVYNTLIETETIVKTKNEVITSSSWAYNDSESLAIDIALYIEGLQDEIKSVGTIAFVCYQTDKKNKIKTVFYGRNLGNPLEIENAGRLTALRSDGGQLLIEADVLFEIDYKTKKTYRTDVSIGSVTKYEPTNMGFDINGKKKTAVEHAMRNLPVISSGPLEDDIPEDSFKYGDEDYEAQAERIGKDQEYNYLSVYGKKEVASDTYEKLKAEILVTTTSINTCTKYMKDGILDSFYDKYYRIECIRLLEKQMEEAWDLEDYLDIPQKSRLPYMG